LEFQNFFALFGGCCTAALLGIIGLPCKISKGLAGFGYGLALLGLVAWWLTDVILFGSDMINDGNGIGSDSTIQFGRI